MLKSYFQAGSDTGLVRFARSLVSRSHRRQTVYFQNRVHLPSYRQRGIFQNHVRMETSRQYQSLLMVPRESVYRRKIHRASVRLSDPTVLPSPITPRGFFEKHTLWKHRGKLNIGL